MNAPAKRIVFDADNPLFRKVYPVDLDIFCRGVQAAESKRLMLGTLICISMSPLSCILIIFTKAIHLTIVLTTWWFLRDLIVLKDSIDYLLLTVVIIAICYRDIYDLLLDIFLDSVVLVTRGSFLRWVCSGYLAGTGFRQKLLTTKPMERMVGTLVNVIPRRYRDRYDEVMDLYLASNEPGNEEILDQILEDYRSCQINSTSRAAIS